MSLIEKKPRKLNENGVITLEIEIISSAALFYGSFCHSMLLPPESVNSTKILMTLNAASVFVGATKQRRFPSLAISIDILSACQSRKQEKSALVSNLCALG